MKVASVLVALFAAALASAKTVNVPIGYSPILRSGDKVGTYPYEFGLALNSDGQPIYDTNSSTGLPTGRRLVSNEPDFSSLHRIGNELYLITQFESPRPGSMYMARLAQNKKDGTLTATKLQHVDWSPLGGLWIPCAGSVTPWGLRLAGEEYEPDARPFSEATTLAELSGKYSSGNWNDIRNFLRQFDLYPANLTFENVKAAFNPYRYGHIVATRLLSGGRYVNEKYYTLGRAAWEMATVMPDQRTVYGTDDGDNVGFFKFVADRPRDLRSGTLYAAKMTQLNAADGGRFRIQWIKLGHGHNRELKQMGEALTFGDIFESATYDKATKSCPAGGFRSINQDDVGPECLKLKPGMQDAAAFLETRRYAAYKGATVEFSKWEGVTYDRKRNVLYTSMSNIRRGMTDNDAKFDDGGPNDIRVPANQCGCVYTIELNRVYSATLMYSLVCGTPVDNPADPDNKCDLNGIASPDNVAHSGNLDYLFIAEDTEFHLNDMLWAYDLRSRNMTRILTTPYGAEVTSAYYYYGDIWGESYLMAVVQHPYESPFTSKVTEPESSGIDGWVGYFHWKRKDAAGAVETRFKGIDPAVTNAEKHSVRSTNLVTFIK